MLIVNAYPEEFRTPIPEESIEDSSLKTTRRGFEEDFYRNG